MPRRPVARVVQRYDPNAVKPFLVDAEGNLREDMGGVKNETLAMQTPKKGKRPGNYVGAYVYHTTSYKNLPGIMTRGIDPAMGGEPGGSCELCEDEELKTTSIDNSRNKIAVATDRLTAATYIHQREKWAEENGGGYVGHYAIVLRFKITEEHTEWSRDPDDKRAWHLSNTRIPPGDLECLTSDGWVKLLSIKDSICELLFGRSETSVQQEMSEVRQALSKTPGDIELRLRLAELQHLQMDMLGMER